MFLNVSYGNQFTFNMIINHIPEFEFKSEVDISIFNNDVKYIFYTDLLA